MDTAVETSPIKFSFSTTFLPAEEPLQLLYFEMMMHENQTEFTPWTLFAKWITRGEATVARGYVLDQTSCSLRELGPRIASRTVPTRTIVSEA